MEKTVESPFSDVEESVDLDVRPKRLESCAFVRPSLSPVLAGRRTSSAML
jgi:hypothetical protein